MFEKLKKLFKFKIYKFHDFDKDKLEFVGSGVGGFYHKMNKDVGIKVLAYPNRSSKEELDDSYEVEKEFKTQKIAFEVLGDITPEPYEIFIVKYNNRYHYAFTMKHIDAYNMHDDSHMIEKSGIQYEFNIHNFMASKGINKRDHGTHNMLVDKNGKVYVIDWGFGASYQGKEIQ